jgi:AcrR family transcriptional regulator
VPTEIIAREGYSMATMDKISTKSKVATSIIYSQFEGGKLEILFMIFLRFWQNVNKSIYESIALLHDPYDRLAAIIEIIYKKLTINKKSLLLSKVLGEHIPFVISKATDSPNDKRKQDSLNEKRKQISVEIYKFIAALDSIIIEGQRVKIFAGTISHCLIRQVLYGSIQMLIYGCYLKDNKIVPDVGYSKEEAKEAVNQLISRFLIDDNADEYKNRKIFSR